MIFTDIPTNSCQLTLGCVLLRPDNPATSGWETAQEFMEALGGDEETFILLLGMQGEILYGLPLGKEPMQPAFDPSWDVDQLCREIQAGVWKVIPAKHPDYHTEVMRRFKAAIEQMG